MSKLKKHWLFKSEPNDYSIDDLARDKSTGWDGIRNFQVRNFMREEMQIGDEILFYHSSIDPPGVAGLAKVVTLAYPDHTAWDSKNPHFDPRSVRENPTWLMVDIAFVAKFKRLASLDELKNADELEGMMVRARGSRLSIQPVSRAHFEFVKKLGGVARGRAANE